MEASPVASMDAASKRLQRAPGALTSSSRSLEADGKGAGPDPGPLSAAEPDGEPASYCEWAAVHSKKRAAGKTIARRQTYCGRRVVGVRRELCREAAIIHTLVLELSETLLIGPGEVEAL